MRRSFDRGEKGRNFDGDRRPREYALTRARHAREKEKGQVEKMKRERERQRERQREREGEKDGERALMIVVGEGSR